MYLESLYLYELFNELGGVKAAVGTISQCNKAIL